MDHGEGNGNPLQYSCLWNPMDRGAWWATVHGVAKLKKNIYICVCVCVCVHQINTLYTLDLIMLHVDCMSIKLGKNLLELQYNYIEKRRSGKMSVLGSLSCQGAWNLYSGKSVDILWDWKNEEIPVRTSNLGVWRWVPEETAKILPLGRDN